MSGEDREPETRSQKKFRVWKEALARFKNNRTKIEENCGVETVNEGEGEAIGMVERPSAA